MSSQIIPKCFLDADGVLVDFMQGAMNIHGITKEEFNFCVPPNTWDFFKFLNIKEEEFYKPLNFDFWSTLDYTEDAHDILHIVNKHFKPEDVCILTSPARTKGCIEGKLEWFRRNLPKYKNVLVGSGKQFCASPFNILLDDSDANCNSFRKHGGLDILVPRYWNSKWEYMDESVNIGKDVLEEYVGLVQQCLV